MVVKFDSCSSYKTWFTLHAHIINEKPSNEETMWFPWNNLVYPQFCNCGIQILLLQCISKKSCPYLLYVSIELNKTFWTSLHVYFRRIRIQFTFEPKTGAGSLMTGSLSWYKKAYMEVDAMVFVSKMISFDPLSLDYAIKIFNLYHFIDFFFFLFSDAFF